MSVQSEAERAARGIAGLIDTPVLNGYDPLTAVPTAILSSCSSGERAVVRMARAVESLGPDLMAVDEGLRFAVAQQLVTLGAHVMAETSQPREHTIPCRVCRTPTWSLSGFCDIHDDRITG